MNSKLRREIYYILNGVKSKNRRGNKRKPSRKKQNTSRKKQIMNKETSKKLLFSSSIKTSINGRTRRRSRLYFNDGNKIHVKSDNNGVIKSFVIPKKLRK